MSGGGGGARVVVVSGPTGVGKTTVCARLVEGGGFARVITATTRAPRGGEQDGRDYLFLSRASFLAGIEAGRFLEWAVVHGRDHYGTPRDQVEAALARGEHALLNIDVQGAEQLRSRGLPLTTFFLRPPEPWRESLLARLARRGDTTPELVERRMQTATREMSEAARYDHQVVNDQLERCVGEIRRLLDAAASAEPAS